MLLIPKVSRGSRLLTGQLCIIELFAWGVLYYSFAVFLKPMTEELGWSNATLSLGFSLSLLVSGIAAPFVGTWIDRHGSRLVMSLGIVSGATGILLWSSSELLFTYLIAWMLIGLGMAGALYAPAFATIVQHDKSTDRNAILVIAVIGALASTCFYPISGFLGDEMGWRLALIILALVLVIVTLPLCLILPKYNNRNSSDSSHTKNTKAPGSFVIITFSLMLADTAGVAINVYLITFLMEQGHGSQAAALIAGLIGLAKIGGRVGLALLSKVPALSLLKVSLIVQSIALFLPVISTANWSMIAMVLVFGAMTGARTILRPAIVVEVFGSQKFAKSNGVIQFFTTLAKSSGPVTMGFLIGFAGWLSAWVIVSVIVLASGLLLFTINSEETLRDDCKPDFA